MKRAPRLIVYRGVQFWYWRLRINGRIIADSLESYATRSNAIRAARSAQRAFANAVIETKGEK